MQYFWTFSLFLVVVTAKSKPVHVQNKNINIIVNADSKEIAKELWKIIERHVKQDGKDGKSITLETANAVQKSTVHEIEQVIKNVVQPSRRSSSLTDSDLAKNFESIVRRSLSATRTSPPSSHFDPIKNIDDIVVEMVFAARKFLDQSEPEIIPESDESTGTGKLLLMGPDSATSSLTLHRMMRGLEDAKNGPKNPAFSENDNPADFSATFDPVTDSNQSKTTIINPRDSVRPLKDDIDEELKNHEGKRREPAEYSNVNVNENRFARRNSNTNINRNEFHRQILNDGDHDDHRAASPYGGGLLRSTTMSPVPPVRHLRKQIPQNSNRRNYNHNSNSNIFGSNSERYRNKLKRQHQDDDNDLLAKLESENQSPGSDDSDDSLSHRPLAAGNTNVNRNTNQFGGPDDDDSVGSEEETKPSVRGGKNPTGNNNGARSSRARPSGNSNINSNTNQIRGGQRPRPVTKPSKDDDYGDSPGPDDYLYDYSDDSEYRLRDIHDRAKQGDVGSGNLNSNSNINSFRRSQNRNVNTNKNYFHRNRG